MAKIYTVNSVILLLLFFSIGACNGSRIKIFPDQLGLISEREFSISPGNDLRVDVGGADVSITSWDRPEVYFRVYGNENAKERMELIFDSNDSYIEHTTKLKESLYGSSASIETKYDVIIPQKFNTIIRTSGGDIILSGVDGNSELHSGGGDVECEKIFGILDIFSGGGDIRLVGGNAKITTSAAGGDIEQIGVSGTSELQTSGGDVICRDFLGSLEISTAGGNLNLSGGNSDITVSTVGGDIDLDYYGENLGIYLSSGGGDITLKLPEFFNADMELSTPGGDITCTLLMNNIIKMITAAYKKEIVAQLNEGGNKLGAYAGGGDIVISKRD
ncbi:MAG: DUF4097 family beta strand repeat-containing protein [Ignavibacteria bacterium]|jgi:DUF4097 and DUF4098 domain-containing protein YvlB